MRPRPSRLPADGGRTELLRDDGGETRRFGAAHADGPQLLDYLSFPGRRADHAQHRRSHLSCGGVNRRS